MTREALYSFLTLLGVKAGRPFRSNSRRASLLRRGRPSCTSSQLRGASPRSSNRRIMATSALHAPDAFEVGEEAQKRRADYGASPARIAGADHAITRYPRW